MEIGFNIIGFTLALGAGITVIRTLRVWQGMFRDELFFILWGFVFLAMGFLWGLFETLNFLPGFGNVLFVFGVALLFLGSSRIFTFTH